jgi:hypothetical protein
MTGNAGKFVCASAVTAGLALVGASFHGVAGLDRELELAAAREQPRTEFVVQDVEVHRHDCPFKPEALPRRRS